MSKLNRRLFLTSTVAIAGAVVASPAISSRVIGSTNEVVLNPLVSRPYSFSWYLSTDGGEVYHDKFSSKEDAVKAAIEHGGGLVAECKRQDWDLHVSGESMLETLYGQNEELMGEDGDFIDPTPEQLKELGDMVSDTVKLWACKNNIDTGAWRFGEVRNKEVIKEPVDE